MKDRLVQTAVCTVAVQEEVEEGVEVLVSAAALQAA
jgi:hypothetical protein